LEGTPGAREEGSEAMSDTKQLVPIAEIKELASSVAASGFFPAFKNPQQALVLMMMAQVEGCHPMQAVQRYDVIQGKPAKKADAMLADFQQRGGTIAWTEYTDDAVEAEFMAKGMAKPCKVRWTYKQATDAGLTGKPTWKQFKRQMLKARVISEGIRISDPGVVAGLYTPEEVGDFDTKPQRTQTAREQPADESPKSIEAEVVPTSEPKASASAIKALCAAMNDLGIRDREDVLSWCAERIGHPIGSRKDLTVSECSTCIEAAKKPNTEDRQPGEEG
jgi:hypothetical protein